MLSNEGNFFLSLYFYPIESNTCTVKESINKENLSFFYNHYINSKLLFPRALNVILNTFV